MKKILSLTLFFNLCLSLNSFAKDYQLSKSEFLAKLNSGTITLEKVPAMAVNPEMITQLMTSMKKEFPGFKEQMFYISYVKSNDFTYFVFYEWYDRGCIFGVTEPKRYRNNSDKVNGDLAVEENKNYEKIDKKYCEKVLGVDLPPSLTRIPNAIKLEPRKK